jgi:hypothetical protein
LLKAPTKRVRDLARIGYNQHFDHVRVDEQLTLKDNIENDTRHCAIVEFLASVFSDRNIVKETGYSFLKPEPLEAFGSQFEGGRTFDLALGNKNERKLILVEVSTTQSLKQGKKIAGNIAEKIEFVQREFDRLMKNLDIDYEVDRADLEYVCCLEKGTGVRTLCETISRRRASDGPTGIGSIILWSVMFGKEKDSSREDVMKVFLEDNPNKHISSVLNTRLYRGVSQRDLKGKVSIPFLLTSHSWIILYKTATELVSRNSEDLTVKDKKRIRIRDMEEYAIRVANAGATKPDPYSQDKAKRAIAVAVRHGVDNEMLKLDKDSVVLRCKGKLKESILLNFERKYVGTDDGVKSGIYAEKRAREIAMELTVNDFDKGIKKLEEYS